MSDDDLVWRERWPLAAIMTAWLVPARASAQVEPQDGGADAKIARATQLIKEADTLRTQSNCRAALEKLDEAEQLASSPGITYMRANCEESLGHLTRARKLVHVALQGGLTGKTIDGGDLVEAAHKAIEVVTEKLVRVRLQVTPRRSCILIDGRALEPDPALPSTWLAGTAPVSAPCAEHTGTVDVLLDPGVHAVSITARGRVGQSLELSVPTGTPPPPIVLERDLYQTTGFVLLGIGLGTLTVGAGLAGHAYDLSHQSEKECFHAIRCSQLGLELHKQARAWGDATTWTLAAGGVITATGIGFEIASISRSKEVRTSVAFTPAATGGGVLFRASF